MHIDHVIPVAIGGKSEADNLQRLCWQCNLKKKHRLTNAQLLEWFLKNKERHLARAAYEELWQFTNFYERPGFSFKEVASA